MVQFTTMHVVKFINSQMKLLLKRHKDDNQEILLLFLLSGLVG